MSKHGTLTRYTTGCRCVSCKRAWHDYYMVYKLTETGASSIKRARNRMHTERKQRLNEIKLQRGCVDCGYRKHPHALHFDHVQGRKSFAIAEMCRSSWERVLREIAKCEVRCANCHAVKTAKLWGL